MPLPPETTNKGEKHYITHSRHFNSKEAGNNHNHMAKLVIIIKLIHNKVGNLRNPLTNLHEYL